MQVKGKSNSAITRVRPFFQYLLKQDATGGAWLQPLLGACPRKENLPSHVLSDPGVLDPTLVQTRLFKDAIAGQINLERCFEYEVPPTDEFLCWLIENSEALTWPSGVSFGEDTQKRRALLVQADPDEEMRQEALDELGKNGGAKSRRKWWAFEGFTHADFCVRTEKLLLFIEGKRTESISAATDWFSKRNQVVRNLELAEANREGRAAAVLLVTERRLKPDIELATVRDGTPHMADAQQASLYDRYLGQVTWAELCEALAVPQSVLPNTSQEAIISATEGA